MAQRIGPAIAALWLGACAGSPWAVQVPRIEARVSTPAQPWTGLEPLEEPGDFRFAVVADRTGMHRAGIFESAMPRVNLLQPAFAISVGDLIEGYTEDPAEISRQWDELEGLVGRLEMPFFYVPGNHDISNGVMAQAWRERFGPSFYHFRYKGVLFIALNSELFDRVGNPEQPLPGPETQAQQMTWLERVLAENRDARWTLLFVHQPLWDRREIPADWLRAEEWLGGRPYTVFAGHYHRYTSHLRRERRYVTLATTGGGSWLRGTPFGEFDHVALVTLKRDGPVIANLLLDGIQPLDVRSAAVRSVVQGLEQAIRAEPIAARADPLARARARFEIRNPLEVPLELQARIEGGRQMRSSTRRLSRELAPGASTTLELDLSATERVPLAELAPGRVHWTLRATAADGTPVETTSESLLLPERSFEIPKLGMRRHVEIDGALDEWGELPIAVEEPVQLDGAERWTGPPDGSFRLALSWDESWLYIAADVTDDALVLPAGGDWHGQDHLALSIDARPDPERSATQRLPEALRGGLMRALIRPDTGGELFAGNLPEGARLAAHASARGYALEVAIPAAALDEIAGGRWRELRINASQHDLDPDQAGASVLWFRPDRFGPLALPGSGTFERR